METTIDSPGSPSRHQRQAADAIRLLSEGDLHGALHFLNLCLDNKNVPENPTREENGDSGEDSTDVNGISPAVSVSLLEKRCLIHMKLHHYDEVLNDARRILDKRTDYSLAYKCLLVALCKTGRLEQVTEILKLWRTCSPQDLDMMECRTKLEALTNAVKNGIECTDAFSNVEDQLGLSYDWLLARKLQDPRWRHRPLPPGKTNLTLCLPFRFGHCSLGAKCPDAHGNDELEEWKSRSTLKTVSMLLDTIELDSGEQYLRRILERLEDSSTMLSEAVPDYMKIRCSKPLEAVVATTENMKVYKWTFAVESKKPLTHVCLLDELHREYFFISLAVIYGATNKINLISNTSKDAETQIVEVLSPTALALTGKKSFFTYKIDVKFKPNIYGTFRQSVVFDVGEEPKIVRKMVVEVVPPPDNGTEGSGDVETNCPSPTDDGSSFQIGCTWNFGNADIVDGFTGDKVSANKLGFALINGNKPEGLPSTLSEPLNKHQYKEIMRYFLTQEERSRQEILAKYNLTAPLSLMENYVMTSGFNEGLTRYSVDKSLYGRMTLFRDVSEDTAVGRLILRSCNYLLLTRTEDAIPPTESGRSSRPRVYLCPISDKTKNNIYIDVGTTCVRELNLKDKDELPFQIQFQLDRTAFMEMKAVIDKLEDFHLDMLFPDFGKKHNIPWSPIKQWGDEPDAKAKLNPRQKESLIAITSEAPRIPPILVIGPFGTGKTFTLAQCIHKLLLQPNIRIMVCTHSNSAADLYIKEYLDPWVQEGFTDAKPLRIYYHLRNLNSVHPDVIQYCIIENLRFRPPTLEEILAHKVIVVTLSTSYILMQMNLPKDTFSHILLDEAAQAMESEAITPLMCAGEDTTLVLAGDHMQLSPELFSEEAKSLHPSLLERLHNYYPEAHPCKLMLCENYRSHSSIIDYVSDEFYNKKLQCSMVQPVHDKFYPLTFFSARGEEVQERDSTSYYNMAEVFEVVDKVTKLVSSWPESWGSYRNESAIGVLTPYSDQVARIRHALRKKGLYSVSVERVLNVQGKQFRAVFLSTVRSFRPWVKILPEAVGNEVDLGFFSNPKLFNTALTRAQSLVAVVGDPVSLCSEGKCRNLWKDFINVCHKNKSLYGISYTQLEQNILGLEMRVTWGLNPLADVFEPKTRPPADYLNNSQSSSSTVQQVTSSYNNKISQVQPSLPVHNNTPLINTLPTPVHSYNNNNTTTPPQVGNPFSSANVGKQQQHLVAPNIQHRPISPGNTGYLHNNPPVMWGPGGVPPIAPQTSLIQPPGLVAPPLHMGYPPVFPPGSGGPPPPHVMYPPHHHHQMSGPPNMGLPHPSMRIPRNRFPNNNVDHPPHPSSSHHHLQQQQQNMMNPNRHHHFPPVHTPQHQQFEPPISGHMNLKNPNQQHPYNIEEHRVPQQQQRFSSSLSTNSTSTPHHLPHNQPSTYRQPQPSQSLTTPEQHISGLSNYQNTSPQHNNIISETQQQQHQAVSISSAPPTAANNSLNFHDLGIAHLPLSDLINLQQGLERFALTNGPTDEVKNLLMKVQEAIYIARAGGGGGNIPLEIKSPPPPPSSINLPHSTINRNIWAPDPPQHQQQPQHHSSSSSSLSRIASIAQQLSEVQIAEAADNIWANLGFTDGTTTNLDHQQPNIGRSTSPSLLLSESLSSSSSSYMRSPPRPEQNSHSNSSRGFMDGMSHNTWSPSSTASSSYGSLTAQLSSNDNYNNMLLANSRLQQQDNFELEGSGGGGAGRSYANVARRAVPVSTGGGSSASMLGSNNPYNSISNNDSGVPPYPFLNQQLDGRMSQQQQLMLLQIQQAKRNKRQ